MPRLARKLLEEKGINPVRAMVVINFKFPLLLPGFEPLTYWLVHA